MLLPLIILYIFLKTNRTREFVSSNDQYKMGLSIGLQLNYKKECHKTPTLLIPGRARHMPAFSSYYREAAWVISNCDDHRITIKKKSQLEAARAKEKLQPEAGEEENQHIPLWSIHQCTQLQKFPF